VTTCGHPALSSIPSWGLTRRNVSAPNTQVDVQNATTLQRYKTLQFHAGRTRGVASSGCSGIFVCRKWAAQSRSKWSAAAPGRANYDEANGSADAPGCDGWLSK